MRISSKGEVVVSANPFVPMDKIDDFVSSKVSWIVKHQKSMQERSQKSMIDDKHIVLFGNSLKIRKTTGKYNHVSYDKDTLYDSAESRQTRKRSSGSFSISCAGMCFWTLPH